jgi:protein-tyrosine phosphatase
MVCMGNICRSPMAETVATSLLEQAGLDDRIHVESFGTNGYHVGEAADPQARAALRRAGWPSDGHRARQLRPDDLARLDLVLCADQGNLAQVRRMADQAGFPADRVQLLRSHDPETGPSDDEVPDPWGRSDRAFDEALELTERACRGLVDELARPGS